MEGGNGGVEGGGGQIALSPGHLSLPLLTKLFKKSGGGGGCILVVSDRQKCKDVCVCLSLWVCTAGFYWGTFKRPPLLHRVYETKSFSCS